MSVLAGRRVRRLALAVTAAAAAVLAATAGGVARASTVSGDPVAMATASSASGTTQPAAPSWPVDNLGQPVVRALSTDTALGGGGGTSNGPLIPVPSAPTSSSPSSASSASPTISASPTAVASSSGDDTSSNGASSGGTTASVVADTTPSGDPEAFFLNMGNYSDQNAEFVAVDLDTYKTVVDTRLPSGYSVTGMAYSQADNAVFMGTGEGPDLYEYAIGGTSVTDLGPSIAGQTIWSLAAGPDGTIWGGTYPDGDIFSYDPSTQVFKNYGQAISGQTYVTALYPTASGVYFGTQPSTDFGELDPSTGAVTQISLPSAYAGQPGNVDGLSMAGDLVFVAIEANVNAALVWNASTGSWVATINPFSGSGVSPPSPANPDLVYYRGSSHIYTFDTSTLASTELSWAPNAIPGAWAWVNLSLSGYTGSTLMFTYYTDDRIYGYNFNTSESYYTEPTVQGSGDQLITLGEGSNGDVYAGAYLTPPGMGQFDPATGKWSVLSGSGQVEGYGTYNGEMVFGRYPEGDLYYDDITAGWSPSAAVAIGDNQNRPVAFAEINNLEAVGSVPESGLLGGDISMWNPTTRAITVYHAPIADQTPVSLVAYDGLLWGGTSIDGGYGVTPTATSGELFAFDPTTGKVVFQMTPKQGAVNVSGLTLDGQGNLWFLADGTLVEFNLATRSITHEDTLATGTDGSMYGLEHKIVLDAGRLFLTTNYELFYVDPVTWQSEELYSGPASDLVQDGNGQLYFVQEPSYVYRYDLPTTTYTPTVTPTINKKGGENLVTLTASEPGGVGIWETEYRIENGPWRTYTGPITVGNGEVISYRALDNAFSPSAIGTFSPKEVTSGAVS